MAYPLIRGLGRIWETGCVKCWLATLAIHSFSFLPHLQPKKQFFSPFFKKTNIFQKNIKNSQKTLILFLYSFSFSHLFFWPCTYETGRDYHGQHSWLPKPLPLIILLIKWINRQFQSKFQSSVIHAVSMHIKISFFLKINFDSIFANTKLCLYS